MTEWPRLPPHLLQTFRPLRRRLGQSLKSLRLARHRRRWRRRRDTRSEDGILDTDEHITAAAAADVECGDARARTQRVATGGEAAGGAWSEYGGGLGRAGQD
jgi:hypothetical protein